MTSFAERLKSDFTRIMETSIEFTKNINQVLDAPGLPDSDGLETIEYNIKEGRGRT